MTSITAHRQTLTRGAVKPTTLARKRQSDSCRSRKYLTHPHSRAMGEANTMTLKTIQSTIQIIGPWASSVEITSERAASRSVVVEISPLHSSLSHPTMSGCPTWWTVNPSGPSSRATVNRSPFENRSFSCPSDEPSNASIVCWSRRSTGTASKG